MRLGGSLLGAAEQFQLGLKYRLSAVSRREATPLRGVAPASARICRQVHLPAHHSPYAAVEHVFSCCVIIMKRGPQWGPLFILTAGVEPTTRCLEGSCSIQLSYSNNCALFQLLDRICRFSFKIAKFQPKAPIPLRSYLWTPLWSKRAVFSGHHRVFSQCLCGFPAF